MKYLFILLFAFILISCDDNTTDNPPVNKVESELLGIWSGSLKQGSDSTYFMVNFADSDSGPVINGELYAKIVTNNGTTTKTLSQKGTVYYTYNKPNIAVRFLSDSDKNSFIGTLSSDNKTMIGEVHAYDAFSNLSYKFQVTLKK